MASVRFEKVRKTYPGGVEVVKGIDLDIADGEFVTLVGPSGCGKSTTLNLIAGFEAPTSGNVRIDDEIVNDRSPKDRGVAMVFQSYALYPHMDVRKNIAFPLEVAGVDKKEIEQRVQETAARLGLEPLLARKPKELSGGQRQRVALGRALVRRPKLCLFDEPLSNLDAALRAQMRAEIKKLHEDLGATFIYVTHDQAEAMTLSDRIVILDKGLVQQLDPPRVVYDRPANAFVAGFIGSPRINLLAPEILRVSEQCLAAAKGRRVTIGIRPENISVSARAENGATRGTVYVVEPMGSETWVTVEVAGARVVGRAPADYAARSGEIAFLGYDDSNVLLFDADSGERIAR
jgi:multiple sugar transport system ATP-binding protein